MLVQRRLDLGRIDVGAADQDHVGAPVGEVEIAVLVERADVAQDLPAARQGARRRRPDTGRTAARPRAGACRSRRSRPAGRRSPSASKAAISPDGDLADRAAVRQPLGSGDDGHRLGLGAGVELHDHLGAEPVDPGLLQPGRAGRGQVPDGLAGSRRRSCARTSLRQAPDPAHHGRHQIDPGGADGGRSPCSVSSASNRGMITRCAPWLRPAKERDERAVVIERPRHHHDVVRRGAPAAHARRGT